MKKKLSLVIPSLVASCAMIPMFIVSCSDSKAPDYKVMQNISCDLPYIKSMTIEQKNAFNKNSNILQKANEIKLDSNQIYLKEALDKNQILILNFISPNDPNDYSLILELISNSDYRFPNYNKNGENGLSYKINIKK